MPGVSIISSSSLRLYGCAALLAAVSFLGAFATVAAQQQQRPSVVIIWGDDIGESDISAYSHGLMGFRAPHWPIGGSTKVGLPGSPRGLQKEDPTIGELLKPVGYAPANSARTIWATAMSSCPPCTASMSSTATFIA